ncbi:hypothetical protein [Vibrio cyclitrophicus]|uniref:Lipoprotein n=2 Tax=Vibrio cyclitrophicus TaxID=47951 RepID=A0A7Z1MIY9_9VIBR|nr:hypothetical protein [Vibrio cyclitrophicus]PMP23044.1 hypothetical protein BCS91_15310 [Vibrio cyclitrophicus]PMP29540.1 hypothetical protein BCS90_16930 [Vibrio cyclitrophicus]
MSVKKQFLLSVTAVVATVSLSGCEGDIESLQNQPFSYINVDNEVIQYERSFTIEQAFNNRQICEEVNWETFEDSRERIIVQYQCDFKQLTNAVNTQVEDERSEKIEILTQEYKKLVKDMELKHSLEQRLEETAKIENLLKKLEAERPIKDRLVWLEHSERKMKKEFPQGLDPRIDEINNKYADIISPVKISEIYQWSTTPDETYIFSYNGFSTEMSDGTHVDCQIDLFDSLKSIYKDNNAISYMPLTKTILHWTQGINGLSNSDIIHLRDLKCKRT